MLEPVKIKGKSKVPEARENAGDQVAVGFSFVSDWLRRKHEFTGPMRNYLQLYVSLVKKENITVLNVISFQSWQYILFHAT